MDDDVLADIRACRPNGRRDFYAKLTPEAKEKADAARRLWQSGRCNESMRTMHSYFRGMLGAHVSQENLAKWLNQDDGPDAGQGTGSS